MPLMVKGYTTFSFLYLKTFTTVHDHLEKIKLKLYLQGDSGGPLVTEVDGRWTVIGLTSWGYSCAKKDSPGVFSKVSSFVYMLKQDIGLSLQWRFSRLANLTFSRIITMKMLQIKTIKGN